MSFWDNVKKFAQPYADEEYDEYEEDEYMDEYEDDRRNSRRRNAAPAPEMNGAPAGFGGFGGAPAAPMAPPMAAPAPAAPAAAPAQVTPVRPAPVATPVPGFNGAVINRSGVKQEVVLFRPTSFNDTTKAADDLKANKAVIVNMENVDKAMARRVVDFLSGCVYALEGDVKKIAQSAYLFCPHNVGVIGDLESIQAEVEAYV
ncbi:MAG: cell division protein SepF [Oscillibacter sp.]|jgi:cell division inhibitor SepF|nr:cell division protein SepF [Oscillibacter sp.]